jgi:hypothetical protein
MGADLKYYTEDNSLPVTDIYSDDFLKFSFIRTCYRNTDLPYLAVYESYDELYDSFLYAVKQRIDSDTISAYRELLNVLEGTKKRIYISNN